MGFLARDKYPQKILSLKFFPKYSWGLKNFSKICWPHLVPDATFKLKYIKTKVVSITKYGVFRYLD